MAKIVRRTNFLKRRKKWEHFKLRTRQFVLRSSFISNMYMGLHIYDPSITTIIIKNVKDTYFKVAPMVESLINQLPL